MSRFALIGSVALGMLLFAGAASAQECKPTDPCTCDPKLDPCCKPDECKITPWTCSPGYFKQPQHLDTWCPAVTSIGGVPTDATYSAACEGLASYCGATCDCTEFVNLLSAELHIATPGQRLDAQVCLNTFLGSTGLPNPLSCAGE